MNAADEEKELQRLVTELHLSIRPVEHAPCMLSELYKLKTYMPKYPWIVESTLNCSREHVFRIIDHLADEFMEAVYEYARNLTFLREKQWEEDHSPAVSTLLLARKTSCLQALRRVEDDPDKEIYDAELDWARSLQPVE
jgi:hypothetical protein